MNAGLIVGNVIDKNGDAVSDALVVMSGLSGMEGGEITVKADDDFHHGWPFTETNSDGYFELGFGWSGADMGGPIGGAGRAAINIYAMKEVRQTSNSNTTYISEQQTIVGYLLKDVLGQASLTAPPFKDMPELLKFTNSLINSYRKMRSRPIIDPSMWSSESWLILSATNLVI
jgi:hypothetical protein